MGVRGATGRLSTFGSLSCGQCKPYSSKLAWLPKAQPWRVVFQFSSWFRISTTQYTQFSQLQRIPHLLRQASENYCMLNYPFVFWNHSRATFAPRVPRMHTFLKKEPFGGITLVQLIEVIASCQLHVLVCERFHLSSKIGGGQQEHDLQSSVAWICSFKN